jgi:post-segregation antitoxin (ccd killing protein)
MSNRFFEKGREWLVGGGDWAGTDHSIMNLQLDGSLTDVGVRAITGATNASPIVVTSAAHGGSNGDIVVIRGIVGNTSANGTWKKANVTTNTYELVTVEDSLNSTGNGAYSSGGCAINLTLADNVDDISACIVGSAVALSSKTETNGVIDAADPSFTSVTGTIHAQVIFDSVGAESAQRTVYFMDGRTQVTVAADAASSATTLWIEKLEGALANGSVLVFSNGVSATLTGAAVAGARSLSVSALSGAIAAGHTADAQTTGSGFPLTLSSGSFTTTFDAAGIAKI